MPAGKRARGAHEDRLRRGRKFGAGRRRLVHCQDVADVGWTIVELKKKLRPTFEASQGSCTKYSRAGNKDDCGQRVDFAPKVFKKLECGVTKNISNQLEDRRIECQIGDGDEHPCCGSLWGLGARWRWRDLDRQCLRRVRVSQAVRQSSPTEKPSGRLRFANASGGSVNRNGEKEAKLIANRERMPARWQGWK